jgi:hypothetical protein
VKPHCAAVTVALLVITGCATGPGVGSGSAVSPSAPSTPTGGPPTSAPSPSPTPTPASVVVIGERLPAGTHVVTPFAPPDGVGVCLNPPQAGCRESSADDSIRITFTVPDGWASGFAGMAITKPETGTVAPHGMSLHFLRGGWMYHDPCHAKPPPDIVVGPTVDDFADALADHPHLGGTTPVAVRLGGYSGKYMDLQLPSDIAGCDSEFFPWEPAFYAQGPSHRWHVWILDVDGVRVVVQNGDFAGTSATDRAEMQRIVDSITIEP